VAFSFSFTFSEIEGRVPSFFLNSPQMLSAFPFFVFWVSLEICPSKRDPSLQRRIIPYFYAGSGPVWKDVLSCPTLVPTPRLPLLPFILRWLKFLNIHLSFPLLYYIRGGRFGPTLTFLSFCGLPPSWALLWFLRSPSFLHPVLCAPWPGPRLEDKPLFPDGTQGVRLFVLQEFLFWNFPSGARTVVIPGKKHLDLAAFFGHTSRGTGAGAGVFFLGFFF